MQLCSGVSYTCVVVQLFLLTKASVVAILSPDDIWPVTIRELARVDFVGLFNLCVFYHELD